MISRFVCLSPASGSVLTDSVSPFLSAPPLLVLCLTLCLSKTNIKKNFFETGRLLCSTSQCDSIKRLAEQREKERKEEGDGQRGPEHTGTRFRARRSRISCCLLSTLFRFDFSEDTARPGILLLESTQVSLAAAS